MAGLYDNVKYANSQFVPQYVGSNYDAFKDAADTLDARYRRNQELTDRTAIALANLEVGKGDEGLKNNAIDRLNQDINTVSSSPENFENSSGSVAKIVRDFATDQNLILAQRNHQRAEQAREMALKLGNQGYNFGDDYDNYTSIDPNTGERRVFKNDVRPLLDYDKKKEDFFNQIASSEGFLKLGQSGVAGILSRITTGGISAKDIKDSFLGPALTRYKTTSEYQQEYEKLKKENPNLSSNELESGIVGSLLATGLERTFKRTDVRDMQDPLLMIQARQKAEAVPPSLFTPTSPTHPAENTVAKPLVSSNSSSRDMTNAEAKEFYKNNPPYAPGVGGANNLPKVNVKGVPETDPSSYTFQHNHILSDSSPELLNKIKEIENSTGTKFTKENYEKQHQEMLKNAGKISASGFNIADDQRAVYDNAILAFGPSSPIVLEGEGDPKTLTEIMDKYNDDDKIEIKSSRIVPSTPNGNIKGGVEFTIYKNGKPDKSGFMRLNDEYDEAVNVIDDVNKRSKFQLSDSYTKDRPKTAHEYTVQTQDGRLVAPTYYTVTIPVNGKPNTFVYTGSQEVQQGPDGYINVGSPDFNTPISLRDNKGQLIRFSPKGDKIENWNSKMYDAYVRPRIKDILNGGQPASTKDVKDFFNDFN